MKQLLEVQNSEITINENRLIKVAIYVRLSRDDSREGESLSISNQKSFLLNYAKEHGYTNTKIYSDDGYSGLSFNRPAMKMLLEDIKNGDINLILAKDLSRVSRNQSEFADLLDCFLPQYNCGLIAVNDGVNTRRNSSDMMSFKNLFNEFYSRDLSRKVKTGKAVSAKKGNYCGAFAPFGLMKDPKNTSKLIIDYGASDIVVRIFKLRCDGLSYRKIATTLNDENVLTPKNYYCKQNNKVNTMYTTGKWSAVAIKAILLNEAYIGNVVALKRTAISFKNKKKRYNDKEDWIRFENAHEALIDMETWNVVQKLAEDRKTFRNNLNGNPSLFGGLLKCPDCGFNLKIINSYKYTGEGENRKKEVSRSSYQCITYANCGVNVCTSHQINEDVLIKIVKNDLAKFVRLLTVDEEKLRKKIIKYKNKYINKEYVHDVNRLESNNIRLMEIEKLIKSLYEDKVLGEIPKDVYTDLMDKYSKEKDETISENEMLEDRINSNESQKIDIDKFIITIKNYMQLGTIDRNILIRLIDHIFIHETEIINGKKSQKVSIHYNFIGSLD